MSMTIRNRESDTMEKQQQEVGAKTDCFAYTQNGKCAVLKDLYCARESCKFYKPRDAEKAER